MADLTFNQRYHRNTIDKGTAMVNPDGSVTTALVRGFTLPDGKIYNIPTFDNETGRLMSPQQAIRKFMPDIEAGKIQGFGSIEEADAAAIKEHKIMDKDAGKAFKSSMFGDQKPAFTQSIE